jgi:tetratricopeptide (TPR) repeat protein
MSLLLEALKKAEKAKEEAQKRAQEGGGSGELRLADETPPAVAEEKRVVTRDELPPITAPLEIQSDDLGAAGTPAGAGPELSLQAAPRAASGAPSRPAPQAQAAQRAAARKPFEAKVREPNPRMPFYITVGVLGAACIGTVIYFWMQLSSPPSIYVKDPKPPADERVVEVARPPVAPGGPNATPAPSGAIPGLPPVAPAPAAPIAQAPSPTPPVAQAAPAPAPKVMAPAPKAPTPAPRVERVAPPKPKVRKPVEPVAAPAAPVRSAVTRHRPVPMINPNVSAGYAAYQAGDMDLARRDYEAALRDDPSDRDALLGLAAVETRAQRFAQAEQLYRRVLDADPRDAHAQAGLVGLRTGQVNPVNAETQMKGLIAVESREGVLYFTLGNQYAQQSRWAEARQAYAQAVAIDPENPDFAYNYAVSLEHARDTPSALQQYRRALSLGLKHTPSFDLQAAEARVQALSR